MHCLRLAAALGFATLTGCSTPQGVSRGPTGELPHAATSARPEWIPFAIRAGTAIDGDPREHHLAELRQLTHGGENAEGHFSPDGRAIVFQSTRDGASCDQMYVMDLSSGETRRVSDGRGKTTCGYFASPSDDRLFFSSTTATGAACPPKPDRSNGYVWSLDEFDVYTSDARGGHVSLILGGPGYDAETTVAPDGSRLVFTSTRDGDLELYTAKLDGSDVHRITEAPGYDGGAFFSPNGQKLVWRASRPSGSELDEYRDLLRKGLVKPGRLEIMIGNADGSAAHAITKNGRANFAPSFLPDSRRIIFASDAGSAESHGRPNFDLYVVDPDGPPTTEGTPRLEQVTFDRAFDGFPMFSPDGRYIVFASNRGAVSPGETNLFVARWVE